MSKLIQKDQDERLLEPFIEAVRQSVDDAALSMAAKRLRERLPKTKAGRAVGWLPRFATAAAVLTGIAITLPLMLPSGNAFAAVQEWFANYRTLEVRTVLSMSDQVIVEVKAQATADGDAHIEQAGIVHVLNAKAGTFTTLMPNNQYFQQPIQASRATGDNLEWVEKLAAFRGDAVKISESRIIDGRASTGHQLTIDGTNLVLWSDAENDAPILLEGTLPGGMSLQSHFAFNVTLAPDLFDIPEGFQPALPD